MLCQYNDNIMPILLARSDRNFPSPSSCPSSSSYYSSSSSSYYSVFGTNLEYMKAGNAMKPLPVMMIIKMKNMMMFMMMVLVMMVMIMIVMIMMMMIISIIYIACL